MSASNTPCTLGCSAWATYGAAKPSSTSTRFTFALANSSANSPLMVSCAVFLPLSGTLAEPSKLAGVAVSGHCNPRADNARSATLKRAWGCVLSSVHATAPLRTVRRSKARLQGLGAAFVPDGLEPFRPIAPVLVDLIAIVLVVFAFGLSTPGSIARLIRPARLRVACSDGALTSKDLSLTKRSSGRTSANSATNDSTASNWAPAASPTARPDTVNMPESASFCCLACSNATRKSASTTALCRRTGRLLGR